MRVFHMSATNTNECTNEINILTYSTISSSSLESSRKASSPVLFSFMQCQQSSLFRSRHHMSSSTTSACSISTIPPQSHSVFLRTKRLGAERARGRISSFESQSMPYVAGEYNSSLILPPTRYVS